MKAIVCRRPGPPRQVLTVEDVDKPALSQTDVLVRVAAASLNPADFFMLTPVAAIARRLSAGSRSAAPVMGTDFAAPSKPWATP
jgi:NADPH:quinone reductase-like Zn-dependent oxidoreductase